MREQEVAVACPCTDASLRLDSSWYHLPKCPVAKGLRGSWCTPEWLADLIGLVDLDPCSNGRSHVQAANTCELPFTSGLLCYAPSAYVVFVNPPYGPGEVVKWVRHHRHTRFIFLLRWDPSTEWFAELHPACTHVWFPDRRIDFDPPPHIESSTNPFPHALYMRDPDPALLERLRGAGYLFTVDTGAARLQSGTHGHQSDDRVGGADTVGGGAQEAVDAGRREFWRLLEARDKAREALRAAGDGCSPGGTE
jgi:hypothetical protein